MDLNDARWRKSTRSSGGGSGDCVEVATVHDIVAVRDSKNPDAATLTFTPRQWRAFIADTKAHRFDAG